MSLKPFSGYQGKAASLEVDGVQFWLVAKDNTDLKRLYDFILKEPDAPFSAAHTTGVIIISATLLPAEPRKNKPSAASHETTQS